MNIALSPDIAAQTPSNGISHEPLTRHEDVPLGFVDGVHERIEAVFVKIASLQVGKTLSECATQKNFHRQVRHMQRSKKHEKSGLKVNYEVPDETTATMSSPGDTLRKNYCSARNANVRYLPQRRHAPASP